MLNLEYIENQLFPDYSKSEKNRLSKILNGSGIREKIIGSLKTNLLNLGNVKLILNHSTEDVKKYYDRAAMVFEYVEKNYGEVWLPATSLMQLSLSDHQEMLLRLCNMREIEYYQDNNGRIGILNTFYNILEGDWEGLKDTMVYLKNIRGEYAELFYPDLHFPLFESFINKDQSGIESVLDELLTEKYMKKRQKHFPEEKFIAFEALAYAKQAWKYGIEVWKYGDKITPDSPYIPAAMLPYEPLPEYTIPYKFLFEFYQQQGVNWRYDPVYPELQGENPKKDKGGFFGGLFGKKSS